MKQMRNRIGIMILLTMLAFALTGCGRSANVEEAVPEAEEEIPAPLRWVQTKSAEIAPGEEAVLFQQAFGDSGFLALINRKTGENIPAELLEDEDFVNDGRYAVYESALFRVTESGKREKVRRYRPLAAPEDTEDRKEYYSESRPRAFRLMKDGSILVLESSYESWQDPSRNPMQQTRNRYYVRLVKSNGVEISTREIEAAPAQGVPDCSRVQVIGDALAAMPQGNSVLFFNTEGLTIFSVTTPFPVKELCRIGEDSLAVILNQDGRLWFSRIDTAMRTASVPIELPQGAHDFCRGETENSVCFLRNSEVFRMDPESGLISRLTSLLSLGINPSEAAAFFVRDDGSLHFLQHAWQPDQTTRELYTVASPTTETDGRREISIGFLHLSDRLAREIIAFNGSSSSCLLEPVDYANLSRERFLSDEHQLVVLDESTFEQFREEGKLADLRPLLKEDASLGEQDLFASVRRALSSGDGALCAVTPVFRIETMAADEDAVGGRNQLSLRQLQELAAGLPADGSLYEPYYTADRLLEALMTVNRNAEELRGTLTEFSRRQPQRYDFRDYTADSSSMESRIYDGRLLLMQAQIGTLEELKWYDAFFPSGACFVGWPKPDGSASILRFDEILGIGSGTEADDRTAAWQFLRSVLRDEELRNRYGFPSLREELEKRMDEDAADVVYLKDEKGKWKRDAEGERIEAARDSWYSPEWRRHYEFSLTDAQRAKLLTLIENAV
ncbi:MAG: hypothetical protein IKS55_08175 [Oscillospiraceae bacterium]|nr:hypothetical protein [Oscillospiraceae bacterium]